MADSLTTVIVPDPDHSIQSDLGEETTPLLRYTQSAWVRNFFIVCLVIVFCTGCAIGIYLLYAESYETTLYTRAIKTDLAIPHHKLRNIEVNDAEITEKKPISTGIINYLVTKIRSFFGRLHGWS
ncbi:uncharacterized protein LOC116180592 [Photinus pyralis]|uniref:Uncharacterized protein n=1 Tax=Photinus pyralis TaxID=7054 RepID=A0A1Y1L4T2_PHOPY|nr:uncharacterized protein LOC116180592 [Photinus pyralis]